MSAGHIRARGKGSWELKFESGPRDPATGRRKIQYVSFRGTKRAAQVKLGELVAAVSNGSYIEQSKVTVAEHVRARVDQWEAAHDPATKTGISGLTAEGYRALVDTHVVPHLGAKLIQKLTTLDIESWHTTLRGRVGARTIERAHRVLSTALKDGVRHGLLLKNVAAIQGAPKVDQTEVPVVRKERIGELIDKLRGHALYPIAITSLFTGMRRNEALALRYGVHVDLDTKVIRIREALEETKAHGIQVKPPKTKAGRRDVSMPEIVVDALRDHRRAQLELRMALGAGKMPDDALVFPDDEGGYQAPRAFSQRWARVAAAIGMPEVTFHALRHTHASQLIDAGIDIVMISKRLGHSKPDITLRIYAHLFSSDDSKASDAINAALAGPRAR
jgi:integrase